MKTNELKKGTMVLLANGWHGELWDNARGNTRVVNVYGDYEEAGSVYSHDIIAYANNQNFEAPKSVLSSWDWCRGIEYTPSQEQCRIMVRSF
jgi:hypothetical protein